MERKKKGDNIQNIKVTTIFQFIIQKYFREG